MRAVVLAVAAGLCLAGCPSARDPAQPPAPSASSQAPVVTVPADYVAVAVVRDAGPYPYTPALTATDTHASYVVGPRYHVGINATAITQRFTSTSELDFRPKRPAAGPVPSGSVRPRGAAGLARPRARRRPPLRRPG